MDMLTADTDPPWCTMYPSPPSLTAWDLESQEGQCKHEIYAMNYTMNNKSLFLWRKSLTSSVSIQEASAAKYHIYIACGWGCKKEPKYGRSGQDFNGYSINCEKYQGPWFSSWQWSIRRLSSINTETSQRWRYRLRYQSAYGHYWN